MSLGQRARELFRLLFLLANNWMSLLGIVLTTGSAISLLWFWVLESTSRVSVNPYIGILLFMILPGVFLAGLLLIPVGILLRRRKLQRAAQLPTEYPTIDLASPMFRRLLLMLGLATAANIAILGTSSFKGIEYMDSNQFCGLTCHTPMAPEYRAFLDSPHSRVGCAQCHIGPGAGWFVKSKLSGVRQVFAVTFNTFHRPIPSPVESLRPARETCEQCHWPQKFTGDRLVVHTKYAEDAANTPSTTILLVKIGGHTLQGTVGIHGRHLDATERISYVTADPKRLEIPKVIYRDDSGQLVEFLAEGVKPEQLSHAQERKMDCVDCHNRPTHAFELPERAVDKALTDGRISRDLPFVKKQAVEVLKHDYPDQASAAVQIPKSLADFYQAGYPDIYRQRKQLVDQAGEAVKEIYLRNVFPQMRVTWGTHPNHLGHDDSPGCFRCHDGSHSSKDGRTITNDCSACHTILAQDETDPKILKDLGMR